MKRTIFAAALITLAVSPLAAGGKGTVTALASVEDAAIGVTAQHMFTGSALGAKWSDPNNRSSFFGTFSY